MRDARAALRRARQRRARAHLKNPREARPSGGRRIAAHPGGAATPRAEARGERASEVRREAPAPRWSQPARVFEMRSKAVMAVPLYPYKASLPAPLYWIYRGVRT